MRNTTFIRLALKGIGKRGKMANDDRFELREIFGMFVVFYDRLARKERITNCEWWWLNNSTKIHEKEKEDSIRFNAPEYIR